MRDHIKRDLLGIDFLDDRVIHENRPRLIEKLIHRVLARARHGLIGRHNNPLDLRRIVQRLQRNHQLHR